jgi:hypothetical protein
MLTRLRFLSLAASLAAFCPVGIAFAETGSGVTPTLIVGYQSGNAYSECKNYGGDCADLAWKINELPKNGVYNTSTDDFENIPVEGGPTITIEESTGTSFDWSISEGYEVCAVIVKASIDALVYQYDGAVSDTGLYSVTNTRNGQLFDISHVTFCFKKVGVCYEEETAWAEGERYVSKGTWAMYVPYNGVGGVVDIRAGGGDGVGMNAGTATFTAPYSVDGQSMVDITINLTNGFIFYYDLANDEDDDNLKIQDYKVKPTRAPKIGLFGYKWQIDVGATTATVKVPVNKFYGVHLDVALPCQ